MSDEVHSRGLMELHIAHTKEMRPGAVDFHTYMDTHRKGHQRHFMGRDTLVRLGISDTQRGPASRRPLSWAEKVVAHLGFYAASGSDKLTVRVDSPPIERD